MLKELIDILPGIINLFVPGFIFLSVYGYFVSSKIKDYNITIIGSIVLSYVFHLLSAIICSLLGLSDVICTVITIVLSLICAVVLVRMRLTKMYKKIMTIIGKITGSKDIWCDFFDINKGTRVRFFAKYNNEDVMIEGDVKFFDACDNGECNFVISHYNIKYIISGKTYESNCNNATMIFNSKDIYGIEARYGE